MAAALPPQQQLRLTQTLTQWRHWQTTPPIPSKPVPVKPLSGGLSNHTIKVKTSDERAFVVRIDGVDPASHGLHRQTEWHAQHLAHQAGIAPRPCYFNPHLGVLVSEYLATEPSHSAPPEAVAELLRSIHALPPIRTRLDLDQRLANYLHRAMQQLPAHSKLLAALNAKARHYLDASVSLTAPSVLCHPDLLAENRLYSGDRLWAIDWEYCAMGERWFDLAVVCYGDPWQTAQRERLITSYLQRSPTDRELVHLDQQGWLYQYLEVLWQATVTGISDDWQEKLEALAQKTSDARHLT